MHLIDQELSGLNQLGAIVGAISSYLCGKQFRQLCPTVDWQIIYCENGLQLWDMPAVHENEEINTLHLSHVISVKHLSKYHISNMSI